jgi:hypothetical protein
MASVPEPSTAGPGALWLGCEGPAVRDLQEQLVELGLLNPPLSPSFDLRTDAAVRRFQRQRPWLLTDGVVGHHNRPELAAAVAAHRGRRALQRLAAAPAGLRLDQLAEQPELAAAVQRSLGALGLGPGGVAMDGVAMDGVWNEANTAALDQFLRLADLPMTVPVQLAPAAAARLLEGSPLPEALERYEPERIRAELERYAQRVGASDSHLAVLDMGAQASPFLDLLERMPAWLAEGPAAAEGASRHPFPPFPPLGQLPAPIEPLPPTLLDPAVTEACLGVGRLEQGELRCRWLGRQALQPLECLSSSKIIPLLNVLCRLGRTDVDDPATLLLRSVGSQAQELQLGPVLMDLCSYAECVGSSNALAATLNQLEAQPVAWIRHQSGNPEDLRFGGRYGEACRLAIPELVDPRSGHRLLPFARPVEAGNRIGVYDLTRLMALLGWHQALQPAQRLEGLTAPTQALAARALSGDTARYVDVALSSLGVAQALRHPVILSKLGYGEEALVYTAFVQFQLDAPRSLALTLRVAKGVGDAEAIRADLTMAMAVTDLIRQLLRGELE